MSSIALPPFLIKTSLGVITIELFPDKAPLTVQNFLAYAKDRFYHDTLVHRSINNFVIQGGGFAPGMIRKFTRRSIPNEANNGIRHTQGTIAMARKHDDPHTATSQWFINCVENDFLNHRDATKDLFGYCVFGQVTDGLRIVHDIQAMPTHTINGNENVPVQEVVVESIKPLKPARS